MAIFGLTHNPLSALVFIFRMSDMQFRAVRRRADKSESEKATDSESAARLRHRLNVRTQSGDVVQSVRTLPSHRLPAIMPRVFASKVIASISNSILLCSLERTSIRFYPRTPPRSRTCLKSILSRQG